jgi:hypothetical protein
MDASVRSALRLGHGLASGPSQDRAWRYNALLRPLRSSVTCKNAGSHSGEGVIADKDEVPGSSPGRPTTHSRRSQRCRQRAGSGRCQPGPRWGRTSIPVGTPIGPFRPAYPGGRLHDDHAPWSPTQHWSAAMRQARPPRAASLLPCPRAASHRRSARRPGLPGRSAGTRGHPHPTQPGSATDIPTAQRATSAASPPGLLGRRPSRPTARPPTGTSTRP